MALEEAYPLRPPRSLMMRRKLDPLVRADIRPVGELRQHLIAMPVLAWRGDHTAIVPARGQHVSNVGVGGEEVDLVRRSPWRDVIALGADHKQRRVEIGERNRLAGNAVAALGKVVVEEEISQIF